MQVNPHFTSLIPGIGWLAPPTLQIITRPPSEEITTHMQEYADALILSIRINTDYLDHLQAEHLAFPPLPTGRGIILDGKIPHWLLTALVRLYASAGAAWIACHQPTMKGAVVVASHDPTHEVGDLIPLKGEL